jgi:hypothetical protein
VIQGGAIVAATVRGECYNQPGDASRLVARRMVMRYSIGLMLMVVILGGCSSQTPAPPNATQSPNPEEEKRTADAMKLAEKLGAGIERDHKQPGKPVIQLNLHGKPVTDADLKELKELKDLQQLTDLALDSTQVTDAGLKELKDLKQLTALNLDGCNKVTDAGLKELKELKQLTRLDLTGVPVTAPGVKDLQEALPKCKIIR